jgi:hypothetical protein
VGVSLIEFILFLHFVCAVWYAASAHAKAKANARRIDNVVSQVNRYIDWHFREHQMAKQILKEHDESIDNFEELEAMLGALASWRNN